MGLRTFTSIECRVYNGILTNSIVHRCALKTPSMRACLSISFPHSSSLKPPSCRVCDSRKYTYFFPTYLMIPPKPGTGLHRVLQLPSQLHSFWEGDISDSFQDDLLRKRCWRIGQEQVQKLRALAKGYEGTHNFHNFTVGREFKERSNHRFMKQIEVCFSPLICCFCG